MSEEGDPDFPVDDPSWFDTKTPKGVARQDLVIDAVTWGLEVVGTMCCILAAKLLWKQEERRINEWKKRIQETGRDD